MKIRVKSNVRIECECDMDPMYIGYLTPGVTGEDIESVIEIQEKDLPELHLQLEDLNERVYKQLKQLVHRLNQPIETRYQKPS